MQGLRRQLSTGDAGLAAAEAGGGGQVKGCAAFAGSNPHWWGCVAVLRRRCAQLAAALHLSSLPWLSCERRGRRSTARLGPPQMDMPRATAPPARLPARQTAQRGTERLRRRRRGALAGAAPPPALRMLRRSLLIPCRRWAGLMVACKGWAEQAGMHSTAVEPPHSCPVCSFAAPLQVVGHRLMPYLVLRIMGLSHAAQVSRFLASALGCRDRYEGPRLQRASCCCLQGRRCCCTRPIQALRAHPPAHLLAHLPARLPAYPARPPTDARGLLGGARHFWRGAQAADDGGDCGGAAAGGLHGRDFHGPGLRHRLLGHQDLQARHAWCQLAPAGTACRVLRAAWHQLAQRAAWRCRAGRRCRQPAPPAPVLPPGNGSLAGSHPLGSQRLQASSVSHRPAPPWSSACAVLPPPCRDVSHALDRTCLISLLQPAPEVIQLFDDLLLLTDSRVIYQ